MTIDEIEDIIRHQHGSAWWGTFHEATNGFRFLPTGHVLTARAYAEIKRRFGARVEPLTPEERKRNLVRGKSDAAARDAGGE